MPRLDYVNCWNCGRHASEVGELSHTRLCTECATKRLTENLVGLKTMSGPFVYRWRARLAASVGASLPTPKEHA